MRNLPGMAVRGFCVALLAVTLVGGSNSAQELPVAAPSNQGGVSSNPEIILGDSVLMLPGAPTTAVSRDSFLYCGFRSCLQVINLSDPSSPVVVGQIRVPSAVSTMLIDGTLLYVFRQGLTHDVVDVSDPAQPRVIGHLTADYARYPIRFGNYLYVLATVASNPAVLIFDVSVPSLPRQVGRWIPAQDRYWGQVDQICGLDSLIITTSHGPEPGLRIYDLGGDPVHPVQVATALDSGVSVGQMVVTGHYVCVTEAAGIDILDLSNPSAPVLAGNIAYYYGDRLSASGNSIFVANGTSSPTLATRIDITDPANPKITYQELPFMGYIPSMLARNDTLMFVVSTYSPTDPDRAEAVAIYDWTGTQGPVHIGGVPQYWSYRATVVGDYGYVTSLRRSVEVVDLRTGRKVKSLPILPTGALLQSGDRGYIIADTGHSIVQYDLSDPANPIEVGRYATHETTAQLAQADSVLVALFPSGMTTYRLDEAGVPTYAGYLAQGGGNSLVVEGNLVVVAKGVGGLVFLDIAPPDWPELLLNYKMPVNTGQPLYSYGPMALNGRYLYVGVDNLGLVVFDISIPSAPIPVGTVTDAGAVWRDLVLHTDYLWALTSGGVRTYNIQSPARPYLTASIPFVGYGTPNGLDVSDSSVVFAATAYALAVQYANCCRGTTADIDQSGAVDLQDLSALVGWLVETSSGYQLLCRSEANVNRKGIVDLVDVSTLINYLLGTGGLLPSCP